MIILKITLFISFIFSIWWIYKTWNYAWECCGYAEERKTIGRKIFDCIWKTLVSFLVFMLVCYAIVIAIGKNLKIKQVEDGYVELYSIKDKFNTEGSLFLGTGTIENVSYYYFYYYHNKGYKQGKIKTNNVTIVEDNNETPRIQCYKNEFVDEESYNWGLPSKNNEITIYVPKGSVKSNMNFDLN